MNEVAVKEDQFDQGHLGMRRFMKAILRSGIFPHENILGWIRRDLYLKSLMSCPQSILLKYACCYSSEVSCSALLCEDLHVSGICIVEETGRGLTNYCDSFHVPFEYKAIAQKWETCATPSPPGPWGRRGRARTFSDCPILFPLLLLRVRCPLALVIDRLE